MSLINEALKKAQREKKLSGDFAPTEETKPPPPPSAFTPRQRPLFFGIALVALLLGSVVVILYQGIFSRSPRPPLPMAQETRMVEKGSESQPDPAPLQSAPEIPVETPPLPPSPVGPEPLSPPVSSPDPSFILSGIVQGEGESLAVINHQISRVGDEVEGEIILEIGRDFVVLEKDEERLFLKMK